jgi:hypothetical protein
MTREQLVAHLADLKRLQCIWGSSYDSLDGDDRLAMDRLRSRGIVELWWCRKLRIHRVGIDATRLRSWVERLCTETR